MSSIKTFFIILLSPLIIIITALTLIFWCRYYIDSANLIAGLINTAYDKDIWYFLYDFIFFVLRENLLQSIYDLINFFYKKDWIEIISEIIDGIEVDGFYIFLLVAIVSAIISYLLYSERK